MKSVNIYCSRVFPRGTEINDDSAAASLGFVFGVDYKGQLLSEVQF